MRLADGSGGSRVVWCLPDWTLMALTNWDWGAIKYG